MSEPEDIPQHVAANEVWHDLVAAGGREAQEEVIVRAITAAKASALSEVAEMMDVFADTADFSAMNARDNNEAAFYRIEEAAHRGAAAAIRQRGEGYSATGNRRPASAEAGEPVAWLAVSHPKTGMVSHPKTRMGTMVDQIKEHLVRHANDLYGKGKWDLIPLYASPVQGVTVTDAMVEAALNAEVFPRGACVVDRINGGQDHAQKVMRAALTAALGGGR